MLVIRSPALELRSLRWNPISVTAGCVTLNNSLRLSTLWCFPTVKCAHFAEPRGIVVRIDKGNECMEVLLVGAQVNGCVYFHQVQGVHLKTSHRLEPGSSDKLP